MSEAALRGEKLFFSDRAACAHCHTGPNLTDEAYHNLGVGLEEPDPDLGRYKVTGQAKHRGAFKTPTLRNVAETAPYMHDGSLETLQAVVDYYERGGEANPWLDPKMKPIEGLTDRDKEDLIAFLESLTGDVPEWAGRAPPLPPSPSGG